MLDFSRVSEDGQHAVLTGWSRAEIYAIADASRDGLLPAISRIEVVGRKSETGLVENGQAFYFWLDDSQEVALSRLAKLEQWLAGPPARSFRLSKIMPDGGLRPERARNS
jgi:hypothetical protein